MLLLVALLLVLRAAAEVKSDAPPNDLLPSLRPLSGKETSPYKCQWLLTDDEFVSASTLGQRTVSAVDKVSHDEISLELLMQYVSHRRPLIVTGVIDKWKAYHTWNMSYFIQSYGKDGSLYDWSHNHGELTIEDYRKKQDEDPRVYVAWTAGSDNSEDVNKMMEDDLSDFPAFLPRMSRFDRTVAWVYSGLKATGATAHRDQVCDGTWVAQFKGEKQWCFSSYPNLAGDQRLYAVTQGPGDLVIFTAPMWHGTSLLSESFSVHGYFPLVHSDLRHFTAQLEALSRHDPKLAEDYGHCFSAWQAHWNGADAFTGSWPLIGMSCLAVLLSCCAMIKLGVWY